MKYVVGVDGGGTKTASVVVGDDLGALGAATTGPANGRSVGIETASANIATSVEGALRTAGVALADVAAICMCLAGFDTDLDLPVPQRAMQSLGYEGPTVMENDVVGAWAGATEARPGVVVIAGTGATALGMNAAGELWRTDGWDYILGDAGSGYAIGQTGIRTAMRALDGRATSTRLARELAAAYGVNDAEGMRRLVDSTHFGKFEIARFATHVASAAEAGDTTAQAILAQAGRDLAENATAIIRRLGMADEEFPIATVGGVFKSAKWVVPPFRQVITTVAPRASFRPPAHPPQIGAAILAMRRVADGDLGSWTLGTGRRHIRRSLSVEEASRT
jgi:N-acetylglucosamine kinase-like BadF-type ATPase